MSSENAIKEQLTNNLAALRQRIAELEKSERQCRQAEERCGQLYREALAARENVTTILESITDAFLAFDYQWRVIYMNSKAEQLLQKKKNKLIGRIYWDVFPDAVNTIGCRELRRAAAEQVAVEYEQFYPPLDTWFEARGFPSSEGVSVFFRDITEYKRAEEERRRAKELSDALNSINIAINSTLDFDKIMQRVIVESTKAIGAETSVIGLKEKDHGVLEYTFKLPEGYADRRMTDEGASVTALAARTKKIVVSCDAYNDKRFNRQLMEQYGIRSIMAVPLVVREEVIGAISFHYHSAAIPFTDVQVDFANKLGASISLALENTRLFESVQKELAERRRAEKTLKNYAAKLEEANRLKDLFTDIIRHDLLNPLGIIKTATEQILIAETEDEERCNTLQMIKRNADKLIDMIKSVSTYAMLESAEKLERRSLNLNEVFREVVNSFKSQLEEKNMKLEYISKSGCCVMANPMIDVVFSNLLSNAIKYSPAGEKIEVNIIDKKEYFKIYVKDWGYGIKDDDKPRLFTRFQRVNKKGVKGTGLGLAITKRVVDLHGGKIWIEDNPEGGSVFWVEIPKT